MHAVWVGVIRIISAGAPPTPPPPPPPYAGGLGSHAPAIRYVAVPRASGRGGLGVGRGRRVGSGRGRRDDGRPAAFATGQQLAAAGPHRGASRPVPTCGGHARAPRGVPSRRMRGHPLGTRPVSLRLCMYSSPPLARWWAGAGVCSTYVGGRSMDGGGRGGPAGAGPAGEAKGRRKGCAGAARAAYEGGWRGCGCGGIAVEEGWSGGGARGGGERGERSDGWCFLP